MLRKKVIVLVDMDCFYAQVEKKLHPEFRNKPCAVVQYKEWQGGSIIAVDYEARKYGVSRIMKGNEAKRLCPELCLARVPEKRGKADLGNYRRASAEVMAVLTQFSKQTEKASIDEAFLDITATVEKRINDLADFTRVNIEELEQTHIAYKGQQTSVPLCTENVDDSSCDFDGIENVSNDVDTAVNDDELNHVPSGRLDPIPVGLDPVPNGSRLFPDANSEETSKEQQRVLALRNWLEGEGNSSELCLAVGALVSLEIRQAVYKETGFTCSAGIGPNKMLAKLAAGMNKPNQQTILPMSRVPNVFSLMPFKKVRHLGGKMGENVMKTLGVQFVGEVTQYPLKVLQEKFGIKNGLWLYEVSHGIDHEPIRPRTITQSIGCGKNFNGPEKLKTSQQVMHWLIELSTEVVERLEEDTKENSRRAKTITVSISPDEATASITRSFPLNHCNVSFIANNAWTAINKGHCIPGNVDLNKTTPLGWTTGIRNIHITAGKFVSSTGGGDTCCDMTTMNYFTRNPIHSHDGGNQQTMEDKLEGVNGDKEADAGNGHKRVNSSGDVPVKDDSYLNGQQCSTNTSSSSIGTDCTSSSSISTGCSSAGNTSTGYTSSSNSSTGCTSSSNTSTDCTSSNTDCTNSSSTRSTIANYFVSSSPQHFTTNSESSGRRGKKKGVSPRVRPNKSKTLLTSYFSPLKRECVKDGDSEMDMSINHSPMNQTKRLRTEPRDEDDDVLLVTQCSKCGEEILEINYPLHLDHHFAMELQQSFNTSSTHQSH